MRLFCYSEAWVLDKSLDPANAWRIALDVWSVTYDMKKMTYDVWLAWRFSWCAHLHHLLFHKHASLSRRGNKLWIKRHNKWCKPITNNDTEYKWTKNYSAKKWMVHACLLRSGDELNDKFQGRGGRWGGDDGVRGERSGQREKTTSVCARHWMEERR